uniref:GB1/RHD3-type G domain-containing protein n=1 Tax=Latimeria chalumnae TaxID=7897 RepID=H3B0S3_LATCH
VRMASAVSMPAPVCLIENTPDGELLGNPEALQILYGITEPVVVVAIVGMYRTGKSYLMNKLAGKNSGFALGSTIQSHTKGIWMWCIPHPRNPNQTLILLDTEGLGDVEKGDQKNDCWIFTLAVLLSSTLVHNSKGTIDQNALEKLHFVSELTDVIKIKSTTSVKKEDGEKEEEEEEEEVDDSQFVRYFPNFIWAVRDFTLELNVEGKAVTEDEYLESGASLELGSNKKVAEYNLPRQCIRNFFPERKCFTFVLPVSGLDINRIEELPESAIEPEFLQQSNKFCDYIFGTSWIKTIHGGHQVNGRMFGSPVQTYLATINSGSVPCLENAVISMATIENQEAIKEAMKHYQSEMNGLVHFPMGVEELSELHGKCEAEAIAIFMKRSFKDDDQKHQSALKECIVESYHEFLWKNEEVSMEICNTLLKELSTEMETRIDEGFYAKPGGYQLYKEDREKVVRGYQETPNKGVKAQEILDQFLLLKQPEANAVLQADNRLTESDKELAAEREKIELIEQQKAADEEKLRQTEQLLEDEKRSNEENMQQLEMKMKEEAENIKLEAQRALESKMREQEELLKKGFTEKAELMEEEISDLKQEAQSGFLSGLAKGIGSLVAAGVKGYNDYFGVKMFKKKNKKGTKSNDTNLIAKM